MNRQTVEKFKTIEFGLELGRKEEGGQGFHIDKIHHDYLLNDVPRQNYPPGQ